MPIILITKSDIFHGNPTNFSCVSRKNSDNIEGVLQHQTKESFYENLMLVAIELLNEETNAIVTAYTEAVGLKSHANIG
jgi:hypothetical protein